MGSDSPGPVLDSIGQIGNELFVKPVQGAGMFLHDAAKDAGIVRDKTPDPVGPAAPPPPQAAGSADTPGLAAQKQKEGSVYSASTTLTSGAGLLDEPKTASRVLLGN